MTSRFAFWWMCRRNPARDNNLGDKLSKSANPENMKVSRSSLIDALGGTASTVVFTLVLSLGIGLIAQGILLAVNWILPKDVPENDFPQGYYHNVTNPFITTQKMHLTLNLHSSTFGAQSLISAYATLEPMHLDRDANTFNEMPIPDHYRIWFDGTFCSQSEDRFERLYPCWFDLHRLPTENATWYNVSWQGSSYMNYSYGGIFGIAVAHENFTESQITKMLRTSDRFIHIESVEATTNHLAAKEQIELARISVGLAGVAAIIAFSGGYYKVLRFLWPIFVSAMRHAQKT